MEIPVDTIYEFHKMRTACHVATVNYFAGLLGYGFPEHDGDKSIEPMRTGYAYTNYAKYHPKYNLPENYTELFRVAHKTHHEHASHHVEFYGGDVATIPDTQLIEMICDWSAANFEQTHIMHETEYDSAYAWFNSKMSHFNWTDKQLKIIRETSDRLEHAMNKEVLMEIWRFIVVK